MLQFVDCGQNRFGVVIKCFQIILFQQAFQERSMPFCTSPDMDGIGRHEFMIE